VNKKMLASLMTIALTVAVVAGGGLYAYFSDTVESQDNVFTAGTLDLQIYGSDWTDGPVGATWVSPSNWAPGEAFTATVRIKNAGNIDALYLAGDIHNYSKNGQGDGSSLADVIEVISWEEYIPGHGWIDNLEPPPGQNYQGLVGDGSSPLTLTELMQSYHSGEPHGSQSGCEDATKKTCEQDEFGNWVTCVWDWVSGGGYDVTPGPAITAGGEYNMRIGFKFMESAGNEYQGDTCQFDIRFMAIQDLSQLP